MSERSLRDLFHLVKRVVPEEQQLLSISSDKTVKEALTIMGTGNFSQLPVVEAGEVLGMFSYRSFAKRLQSLPQSEREILSLPVEEFMEDPCYASINDELTSLLAEFGLRDALLIGSPEKPLGIVTTVDVLKYFYGVASPYVLLREIELAIRELISSLVSPEDLRVCIEKSLSQLYDKDGRALPTDVKGLTFNDYVMILKYKGTFEKFRPAFGGSAEIVYSKLKDIPELRNVVFHFKRELTVIEYERLRETRDWLLMRIRKVDALGRGRHDD